MSSFSVIEMFTLRLRMVLQKYEIDIIETGSPMTGRYVKMNRRTDFHCSLTGPNIVFIIFKLFFKSNVLINKYYLLTFSMYLQYFKNNSVGTSIIIIV